MRDTTYVYDRFGMTTQITDPLGNVTEATYDEYQRHYTLTLAGDAAATNTTRYMPGTNDVQFVTNALNETSHRGADTATDDTRFALDPLNEDRRVNNQAFVGTINTRDANGNVLSVGTNWYSSGANLDADPLPTPQSTVRSMSYTYGAGGVIASMTDADGNTTNYSYDTLTGYLTQIDAPAGNGEGTRRVTTITRNTDGTPQQIVDPKARRRPTSTTAWDD